MDKNKEPFAFVCFASADSAKECKDKLTGTSLFSQGKLIFSKTVLKFFQKDDEDDKLIISWVLNKQERSKQNQGNNNNIYTNKLKPTVTEEQLRAEFSKFGEILSISIQIKADKPTNSAFICFKNSEDAKDAISKSSNDKKILDLYDGNCFITFHQTKERRKDYLRVVMKKRPPTGDKPEGNLNYAFTSQPMPGQPMGYPNFNYNMPFIMAPSYITPNNAPQGLPQSFPNNYLINSMMPPQQHQANINNRNMNIGMNLPRKNIDPTIPRKNYQGGGSGYQVQTSMGGNVQQQKPRGQYGQQQYGARVNQNNLIR